MTDLAISLFSPWLRPARLHETEAMRWAHCGTTKRPPALPPLEFRRIVGGRSL